jgi:hypothetical protein
MTKRPPALRSSTLSTKPSTLPMLMRSSTGASTACILRTAARNPPNRAASASIAASARSRRRRTKASAPKRAAPAQGGQGESGPSAAKAAAIPAPNATASQGNRRRCSISVRMQAASQLRASPASDDPPRCRGRPARTSATSGRAASAPPARPCTHTSAIARLRARHHAACYPMRAALPDQNSHADRVLGRVGQPHTSPASISIMKRPLSGLLSCASQAHSRLTYVGTQRDLAKICKEQPITFYVYLSITRL